MLKSPRIRVLSNLRHNIDSRSANAGMKSSFVLGGLLNDGSDGCRDTQNKTFKIIKMGNDYMNLF